MKSYDLPEHAEEFELLIELYGMAHIRCCINMHEHLVAALRAICDRIDGVFDSKELMAVGPLGTQTDDIKRIAQDALKLVT